MSQSSTQPTALPTRQIIRELIHARMTTAIETVLEEELAEFLCSEPYERAESRRGYRNGHVERVVTTASGARRISVPRARVMEGDRTVEFRSAVLPRYTRRMREVDEALMRAYLGGLNTRKIRRGSVPFLVDFRPASPDVVILRG